MRKHFLLILMVTSLLAAACTVPVQPAPAAPTAVPPAETEASAAEEAPAPAAEADALSVEALKNATYSGIYEEPITLTDGLFEAEPFSVQYVEGQELVGDLDGDGVDDTVVFLIERGGGTAAFTYLGAQLNGNGQPVDAGAAMVEDRTQILSASIEDGQIQLEITTRGPGDADCCPSYRTNRTYALQDGRLAEVSAGDQDLVRISAADLDGTTWALIEFGEGQPVLEDTEITIRFEDGAISGSAGCNSYSGSFSLSEDNPFLITMGPLASTQMACPEPVLDQETAYLSALERVSRWGYAYGQLALAYTDDQGNNIVLLFAPQAAAEVGPAADTLTGQTWQWVSFTNPVEQFDVETPESYLLTFNEDGTVNVVADCNNAQGSYTDEDGALTIALGPMTMAACPEGSRSDQFVQYLGFAARTFFQDGMLFIDLFADGGTLEFQSVME